MNLDGFELRKKELDKVRDLVDSSDLSKMQNLVFLGAPDSGKTELIDRAGAVIREMTRKNPDEGAQEKPHQGAVSQFLSLAIDIDFGSVSQISWYDLRDLIKSAAPIDDSRLQKIADILEQFKDKIDPNALFERLEEIGVRVFFLIDNIDQGLSAKHTGSGPMVTAQDILNYAHDSPSVVKVIMTSSRWRDEFDNYYLSAQWLKLLSVEEAEKWARLCLQEDTTSRPIPRANRQVELVLEWAGHHPYYIKLLCEQLKKAATSESRERSDKSRSFISRLLHRPPSQEEIAIKQWRDKLQSHLNELWEYLELYTDDDWEQEILALVSILEKQPLDDDEGVLYLRERSIVSVKDPPEIPSRLMREFLKGKVRVVKHRSISTTFITITSEDWVYKIVLFLLLAVTGIVTLEGALKTDLTDVYWVLLVVFAVYVFLLFWVRVLKPLKSS